MLASFARNILASSVLLFQLPCIKPPALLVVGDYLMMDDPQSQSLEWCGRKRFEA